MILPVGAESIAHAVQIGTEIFHTLKKGLAADGHNTSVGDEGGFAPNLSSARDALDFILKSVEKAGFKPGSDIALGLDVASSEFYKDGHYELASEGKRFDSAQFVDHLARWVDAYPIVTIEDGMSEDDWEGWKLLTEKIGGKCQLVGDDLFVTNVERLQRGIDTNSANALLVKVNQIGTLTETIDAVTLAHRNGYRTMMSHRSGETEDTTIADLAVATNSGQIKTGAPARGERAWEPASWPISHDPPCVGVLHMGPDR